MTMPFRIVLTLWYVSAPIISVIGQNAEKIFQQGNEFNLQENYKDALVYVDSSLNIDSSLYQRYHFRADIKTKLGMIESAIADITECIKKCNCTTRKFHVADYYLDRAELQIMKKDTAESLADVTKSISINSASWRAYNFRSSVFAGFGKLNAALADLDKSIQINDNEASTFIQRGQLWIQMGNIPRACSDFSKVRDWGIDDFDTWLNANCR